MPLTLSVPLSLADVITAVRSKDTTADYLSKSQRAKKFKYIPNNKVLDQWMREVSKPYWCLL